MTDAFIQALEAVDGALSASLAATLSGMTLTAASLLSTLVKNQGDKVRETKERKLKLNSEFQDELDPFEKKILGNSAENADAKHKRAVQDHLDVKRAFQALLIGFGAFTFNLLESLTLDPNIEHALLKKVGATTGVDSLIDASNYAIWLSVDVGSSLSSVAIGLSAICFAAITLAKVVPRL